MSSTLYSTEHFLCRRVSLLILLIGLWKFLQGGLLHQFYQPPAHYAGIDPAYWLLHGSGLFVFMNQEIVALIWAIVLAALLALSVVFPKPSLLRLIPMLLIPYGLGINAAFAYPSHSMYPILFGSCLFFFAGSRSFSLFAEAIRFYAAFVFFSAACYKLFGGALAEPMHMADLLIYQHGTYFAFHQGALHQSLLSWLIAHPGLVEGGFLFVFGLQAAFVLAFFTRRFDHILIGFIVLFVILLWLIMRLDFTEMLVFLPFFRVRGMGRQQGKLSNTNGLSFDDRT